MAPGSEESTVETQLPSGTVTFLFTDIEGSTRMAHSLGAEYRTVLHDHRRLLRGVLGRSTGAELLTEGDSFFVAFADAATAVTAAIDTLRALAAHTWPYRPGWTEPCMPRLRIGIHTGPAVPKGGEYATHVVHRAARVRDAAHGGQVLCSEATFDAAKRRLPPDIKAVDLGLHRLRGFDDPERLMQLVVPDLESEFPPPRTEDARAHNLPYFADFVGREAEISRLRRLVDGHRLVSATGPSGVGKTRVVVEMARRAAPSYTDGVWYAELPGAGDADATAGLALARAVGVRPDPFRAPVETVLDWLRHRKCVIILDGAQARHADFVRRVLAECWQARILLVSRAPMGLSGEVIWAVPSMVDGEAVRLLELRAAAARGGVPVEGCASVARRLGGLPLALELAAARLRVVSPEALAKRLDDDLLGVLDGPGRVWSAALDASYEALPPGAVRLLHAFADEPDPVDVDAVERLLGHTGADPLDALAALVDASLVDVRYTGTAALYRLSGPVRAYAASRGPSRPPGARGRAAAPPSPPEPSCRATSPDPPAPDHVAPHDFGRLPGTVYAMNGLLPTTPADGRRWPGDAVSVGKLGGWRVGAAWNRAHG
ncbi:adenylate/guanylate cyclase domain-containing protein [Phytomonospora sp. NPDC050363]|uniref:adenylate/guanylate cyclase domain-containing protein n=1 Tax=Phytomonospora sp. NPDC050363 TaxID=3155642 RepID=UPI0033E099FC